LIEMLEAEMLEAAKNLEFEKAAALRDRVAEIRAMPDYGSSKITLGAIEQSRERPGMARSKKGITKKGRKKPSPR
jgi:excinuclease ABC subunit B